MKTMLGVIVVMAAGKAGSIAMSVVLAQSEAGWITEMAKSWPFGLALVVVVFLFLRHMQQETQDNRKFIGDVTDRLNISQERNATVMGEVNSVLSSVHAGLAENTRALDRFAVQLQRNKE